MLSVETCKLHKKFTICINKDILFKQRNNLIYLYTRLTLDCDTWNKFED